MDARRPLGGWGSVVCVEERRDWGERKGAGFQSSLGRRVDGILWAGGRKGSPG